MKKVILLIIIIFLCGGCYYTELNDLAIVDTLAVEKENDKYKLYISIVDTSKYKNEENIKTKVYTSHGKTIEKAYQNFYLKLNKTIYLSSINNLLVSNLNSNDYKNLVDFFIKDKTSRNTFNIIYVKNSSILDILKSNTNINDLLLTNMKEFGTSSKYSLEEFYSDNLSYSFVPTIYYKNRVLMDNYSVFKNYKYIGNLNKNESIITNILNEKVKTFKLSINNNYISVSDIRVSYNLLKEKEVIIYSTINKNIKNKYDSFLKKNIDSLLKKYNKDNIKKIKIKTTVRE